jgi:hypothetical protein
VVAPRVKVQKLLALDLQPVQQRLQVRVQPPLLLRDVEVQDTVLERARLRQLTYLTLRRVDAALKTTNLQAQWHNAAAGAE